MVCVCYVVPATALGLEVNSNLKPFFLLWDPCKEKNGVGINTFLCSVWCILNFTLARWRATQSNNHTVSVNTLGDACKLLGESCQCQLNDHMVSYWCICLACCAPSRSQPNGGLTRSILILSEGNDHIHMPTLQSLTVWQHRLSQTVWLGGRIWLPRTPVALIVHLYMHSKNCWKIFAHLLLLLQVTVDLFNYLSLLVHGGHKILDLLVQQVDICHPTVTNLRVHEVCNYRCKSQYVRRMCAWLYTLWSMLHISTAANFHESVTAALTAVSKRCVCGMEEKEEWFVEDRQKDRGMFQPPSIPHLLAPEGHAALHWSRPPSSLTSITPFQAVASLCKHTHTHTHALITAPSSKVRYYFATWLVHALQLIVVACGCSSVNRTLTGHGSDFQWLPVFDNKYCSNDSIHTVSFPSYSHDINCQLSVFLSAREDMLHTYSWRSSVAMPWLAASSIWWLTAFSLSDARLPSNRDFLFGYSSRVWWIGRKVAHCVRKSTNLP